jgi:hypothetical protein
MGDKDEEVQWRQVTLTEVQWMYRYNTEAKNPTEQTPKQQRTRMKKKTHKEEGINGRGCK